MRVFFHVRDGVSLVRDDTGQEVHDLQEARAVAARLAGEVRRDLGRRPALRQALRVDISDRTGAVLASISLDEAPPMH